MGATQTTEIIARGVLIHQNQVLMCRHIKANYCYLPGGHVEFAEHAQRALTREIMEETGLESVAGPLLLTTEQCFDDGKHIHHEINMVFLVEQLGPTSTPPQTVPTMEKKIDFQWVDLAQLAQTDVRPTEIKAWLMSGGVTSQSTGPWLSGFE